MDGPETVRLTPVYGLSMDGPGTVRVTPVYWDTTYGGWGGYSSYPWSGNPRTVRGLSE